jgi:hypothetical protein
MGHAFQPAKEREAGEVGVVDPSDLEYTVRADIDAVPFSFAPGVIDDGSEYPRRCPAVLPRPLRISGRATCLLSLDLRFAHSE